MLADHKGRFLYEIRPDLFPQGFLTQLETEVWAEYYQTKERTSNG